MAGKGKAGKNGVAKARDAFFDAVDRLQELQDALYGWQSDDPRVKEPVGCIVATCYFEDVSGEEQEATFSAGIHPDAAKAYLVAIERLGAWQEAARAEGKFPTMKERCPIVFRYDFSGVHDYMWYGESKPSGVPWDESRIEFGKYESPENADRGYCDPVLTKFGIEFDFEEDSETSVYHFLDREDLEKIAAGPKAEDV
ncbi:MAG: hypothetical protein LBR22_04210 [Desulfovibrio sp.]|jgi:hypothetical protein|nr:hypothetical protein [Desulfovibrio sp.]